MLHLKKMKFDQSRLLVAKSEWYESIKIQNERH